ncbi:MAG TPA: hypothetical protein VMH88_10510 [Gemmatimonadales bacterium]|nr:hypothetical protein [Gemmatimonadales bacterium]
MVSPLFALRSRRGASRMGCLFTLLIFFAALYYGVNIGELYFRYYRLLDEMQTQARVASALDDGTIRRRIEAAIQEIGLPDEASASLEVVRTPSPREITIETEYRESVHLPLFDHTFRFHPKTTEPL